MAEEVNIVNVGGDDGVASEATLLALVESLERQSRQSGMDPKKTKQEAERLNKEMKNLIETFEDTEEAFEDIESSASKASAALSGVGSLFNKLLFGFSSLIGSASNFAEELLGSSTQLSDFARHMPLVGDQLEFVAAVLDRSINTYRELSQVGATFGNSIETMRRAAAEAGLPLETFGQLILNNSENLRMLGGTVNQGAARFANLSGQLRDTGYFDQLKNLGFTTEEIYEGLSDYNALQRRLGMSQRMTDAELIEGTNRYLTQLDRLARVTGLQREEVERALNEVAADAAARTLLSQFEEGSEEFENLSNSLLAIETQLSGPMKTAFQDLLDGTVNYEDTGKLLAMLGDDAQGVRQALAAVGQGADPSVLMDAFESAGGALEEFAGGDARARASLIQSLRTTDPVMADFLDNATRLMQASDMDFAALNAEQQARDDTTGTLLLFDQAINDLRAEIQKEILDSGLFATVASGFSSMVEIVASDEMQERLRSGMQYMTNFLEGLREDPRQAIQDLFADLTDAFLDFFLGADTRMIQQPGMGEVEVEQERTGGFWQTTLQPIVNDLFEFLKTSMMDGITSLWQDTYIIEGMVAGIAALWAAPAVVSALAGRLLTNAAGGAAGAAGAGAAASRGGGIRGILGNIFSRGGARILGALGVGAMLYDMNKEQSRAFSEGGPEAVTDLHRERQENMLEGIESIPGLSHLIDGYEAMFEMVHGVAPARTTLETENQELDRLSTARENQLQRVRRSLEGENEFWGSEVRGREQALALIQSLNEQINALGGESINLRAILGPILEEQLAAAEAQLATAQAMPDTNRRKGSEVRAAERAISQIQEALDSLPQLQSGGIVDFPMSGGLAMLHGREAVIPLDELENMQTRNNNQSSIQDIIDNLYSSNTMSNDYLDKLTTTNQGSTEALKELNTIMKHTNLLLQQIKSVEDKIERNTASNTKDISTGRVTRMR